MLLIVATFAQPLQSLSLPWAIVNARFKGDNKSSTCYTFECNQTAERVLEFIDQTVDPCEDFYKFSCGNFLKTINIPDDKTAVTTFGLVDDLLQEQLKTLIEEPIQEQEPKSFQLPKKLYKACMNTKLIEEDGLTTIKQILADLGGWPVLEGDKWRKQDFDWRQTVYKFRKMGLGYDYFMHFSVFPDKKNSTNHIIYLDEPSLDIEREYLIEGFSNKIVKAYYDYMVDIAVIFGADKARAAKELKNSLDFMIALANISLPREKRLNSTALYNPMTIAEMQSRFPSIPWNKFINTLLAPHGQVSSDEVIIVRVPSYLKQFEALISRTPKKVQANYLMWWATSGSVSYLNDELRKRKLEYSTIVNGQTEQAPRWKECIDVSLQILDIATGALYVRKYFNEQARQNILEIVRDIRSKFEDTLTKVNWMDEETKKHALDKAKFITNHIGYPDELKDNNKLNEYYENLELDSEIYFKSLLNLSLFYKGLSFKQLRQPVNKTNWITHGQPAVVNAFYSFTENSIQFPAGILQDVFFDANRPRYMNYGAIGSVIGHEIIHGFDEEGRQYDKNGNLVEWWAPKTKEAFLKKAQCIIDQYGNYAVPEINLNINGINTQGENIADNGGVKEAYLAYKRWLKQNGAEQTLPGLNNFTPNQMFWISASQTSCAKYRSETLKFMVLTDPHSPAQFQVNGPLSNLKYFADDFNCPINSNMNPQKKCKVW